MPPAIVYTDMADSVDPTVGIFAGLNFFILQRVPQRSHYVSLVESNGGRLVKLEAQADYLIADHLRHDVPAASLSYKFIEEAIKRGELPEDEEPFFANRRRSADPGTTTAAATSSKKSTRTLFTDDDDKLLYKLVHKANEQGLAVHGNTLYKALAAHNPRHTYQSWRDRYIKNLSMRPPTAWEAYPDANLPPLDEPAADIPSTAPPRSTARSAIASTQRSRVHRPFTEEDDQELTAWVTSKAKQGAPISGNAIYQELEARNPRHTYHSWRDRWLRHLSKIVPDDDDDDDAFLEAEHDNMPEELPEEEVTPARSSPLNPKKTPLRRPGFRIPPGASAAAQSSSRVTPMVAALPIAKALHSTPKAAAQNLVAVAKEATEDTAPLSPASGSNIDRPAATRAVVTSKNKANTPMVRSRDLSSPVMSQQTPAQPQPHQQAPPAQAPASTGQTAAQTSAESRSHDDSAFTDQDLNDLLRVALDIQNVCVGRYQESWIKWADYCKTHTAVEWRSFYERRVLPIVLHREDNPERSEPQKRGQWAEFWENQGQPIEVLPYKTASRVHPTSLETVQPAEQVQAMGDMAEQVEEVEKTALLEPGKRKLQTPEKTLEESASKRQCTSTPSPAPNKALAPAQKIPDETVSLSSKEAASPSHNSDEEEETSEDQAAGQLRREMAEDKDDRHQLTRANLARIQADNGMSKERRGVDIEEDDEDDDQGDFAAYLASMLPQKMKDKALETVEDHDHQDNQEDDEVDEDDDEDMLTTNNHELEPNYDPALLEIDPELDNPSYQSSLEYSTNNTAIHLDVPATQAWEASSAPSQSQPQRFSTQAIYAAETQPFDADVPLPPSDLYEEEEEDQRTYTTANTDSQILAEDEVWPWIDEQMSIGGYSEATVIDSLRRTSFNPKLAALVLQAQGEEVDVAGVWTEADDQIVEGSDARAIRRLETKHGTGSVEKRITFLAEWRRDQELATSGEVAE